MAKPTKSDNKSFRVNDEIPRFYREVRIVGENIESRIVSISEAKQLAKDMEVDLVEINPNATPPIVRLCDYSKFQYELKKKEKSKKQQSNPLKEVQLRTNIAQHDLETKANQAKKFLANGSKVKVVLTMKGRELGRREESKKAIYQFLVALENDGVIESLKDEDKRTIAILRKKN